MHCSSNAHEQGERTRERCVKGFLFIFSFIIKSVVINLFCMIIRIQRVIANLSLPLILWRFNETIIDLSYIRDSSVIGM